METVAVIKRNRNENKKREYSIKIEFQNVWRKA